MTTSVSPESIKQIFTGARTHHAWLEREVGDDVLSKIFDVAKWGPTSVNSLPARFLFLKSSAAKSDLLRALSPSNVQQVQVAPVTAVIAFDEKFYDELPALFTAFDAKALFLGNPTLSAETAFRNSALQGAYFMLAARALGLDVGPMSGFDNAKVDENLLRWHVVEVQLSLQHRLWRSCKALPARVTSELRPSCKDRVMSPLASWGAFGKEQI